MRSANTRELPFVVILLASVCIGSLSCEQAQTSGGFKETTSAGNNDDQLALGLSRADGMGANAMRANSRLLAVPLSLARYMFPHSRPGEHQSQAALMAAGGFGAGNSNSKRSSSQLDALTGVTGLGKRSVPDEYIILPRIGRENLVRNPSRITHEMRWAPLDTIEAPVIATDY